MTLSVFQAARESPDAAALVTATETLSYAALASRVRAALGWLGPAGGLVGATALVAEPTLDAAVAFHALVATGTPVFLVHPKWTSAERERALGAVRPTFRIPPGLAWTGCECAEPPSPVPDDERPLAMVYTSGSSGGPKGVELSRLAIAASAAASAKNLGWRDDDRWLLSLSFAHVGGLSVLTRCLAARRAVVLDPGDVAEAVARHRVTLLSLVPTQLARLVAANWHPPAYVRAILVGGAALTAHLRAEVTARGWPILATYGMTETSSQVATQAPGDAPAAGAGRPLSGMEVRAVGGVLQVRGPGLFTRYVPSGERERTSDGWFETGDLGHVDANGVVHVLGRRDDLIITGGEKVLPQEVEDALNRLPDVQEACVFGSADEAWGQVVAAAVVPRIRPWDAAQLAGRLQGQLAPFKWPRQVAVVAELPKTANGKVDRKALAVQCRQALRPLGTQ